MRGLAAMYVVFFHVVVIYYAQFQGWMRPGFVWMTHGHWAVNVFIVLSGFCLTLPLARSRSLMLEGGFGRYMTRRAVRILPPYYAAVVLSLLALVLSADAWRWVRGMPVVHPGWASEFSKGNLISHVLLVHNFTRWANALDGPMWSVATEFQIYFFFPLLLLPVLRKFGRTACVLAGVVVGLLPVWLFSLNSQAAAAPWYLGLFAMGMVAADIGFSVKAPFESLYLPAAILAASAAVLLGCRYGEAGWWTIPEDTLIGAATACCLVWSTRSENRRKMPVRWLEMKLPVWLGTFSYSIYLMHMPIIWKARIFTDRLHLSPLRDFVLNIGFVVPIAVGGSMIFHVFFERPFLRRKQTLLRVAVEHRSIEPDPRAVLGIGP
jgi:peptidoglycan/LPS O-acetylase OafA/YrhL